MKGFRVTASIDNQRGIRITGRARTGALESPRTRGWWVQSFAHWSVVHKCLLPLLQRKVMQIVDYVNYRLVRFLINVHWKEVGQNLGVHVKMAHQRIVDKVTLLTTI